MIERPLSVDVCLETLLLFRSITKNGFDLLNKQNEQRHRIVIARIYGPLLLCLLLLTIPREQRTLDDDDDYPNDLSGSLVSGVQQ